MTALFLYTELMIRILLLLVSFMSLSAKADMDEICFVTDPVAVDVGKVREVIKQSKCIRNNVLTVFALDEFQIINIIDNFCRYDREIHFMNRSKALEINTWGLTCILYSSEGRKVRNILSSRVKD